MSSLSIPFSSAICTSSIPKISTGHHRRTARMPAHDTSRLVFRPSAVMVEGSPMTTSSNGKEVQRLITTFKPSMWKDIFSTFSFDNQVQEKYLKEIEELKKEVRSTLMSATHRKLFDLIDNLERMGIAYHFETEIEDKLKQAHASLEEEDDYDLFTTALRFRLLRQHRYHVSCDPFAKFVDQDNKLKESLSSDVEGLLSLFEASHLRIHNEDVLDEAIVFTTHHLNRMMPQLESPLKEEVKHALRYPLHKCLGILSLRFHIDRYENDKSRDEVVLRLGQVNFNYMQNIYMNELYEITTWWNKLQMTSKVPYFRDRLVECYMWGLAYHFEPEYAPVRVLITKYYMTATTVDDTYDNYATLEEIELFTQAIDRWSEDEIDQLPDEYLKIVYKGLMNFTEEFRRDAEERGKGYVIPYFIEETKRATQGYANEQRWIMKREMPSFEEYMVNSRVTSLMYVTYVAVVAVIESATKETVDWALSDSDIFVYTNDIGRLIDDLATHRRERKDGTMLTSMDYYMKEYGGTMEEGEAAFRKLMEEKWKLLNAAWVDTINGKESKEIVVQVLDLARICGTLYGDEEDGFTYPEKNFAPLVAALLMNPIHI
uniref:11-hydroxy vulgarisane synthase n=1 Tax=Prunella vulgaris TaxID=39358 RepID=A0A3Q8J789_PRUVU|nr:11-hydroxy vulgarisane synthase [Prunella vulgaris]